MSLSGRSVLPVDLVEIEDMEDDDVERLTAQIRKFRNMPTNQSRLGFFKTGLKETGANRFQIEGKYKYIETESMRKIMFLSNIKACKQALVGKYMCEAEKP